VPGPTRLPRPHRGDLAAIGSFLLVGLWVTSGLWLHPGGGVADNPSDQAFFEFILSHGLRVFTHADTLFRTTQMGYPDGINLMANTSVLGISLPMAPVTWLLGARVSFDLALLVGLTGTAISWYVVLSRPFGVPRLAAWVGAMVCGFGPGLIAQSNSHLNLVGQILVPILVWRVLRLAEPGRWLRNGLWLALVAVWQFFVSSEVLLLTAVAVVIVLLMIAWREPARRSAWRPMLAGLVTAGVAAGVVLAYPLWVQFRGEGAYSRLPPGYLTMGADPISYLAYATRSIGGTASTAARLSYNPSEENTFLGLPLVLLCCWLVWRGRRRPVVLGLGLAIVVAVICSMGPQLTLWQNRPGVKLPWALAQHLPLLSSIVPVRWGLVAGGCVGVLLALTLADGATPDGARADGSPGAGRRVTGTLAIVAAIALVPLFPKPLPVSTLQAAPAFISDGGWAPYTAGGRSLMFLPMASNVAPDPIRWSAEKDDDVTLAQGYFLTAGPGGTAISSSWPRPLSTFLNAVGDGDDAVVTHSIVQEARADLAIWRVGAVVLLPADPMAERYRAVMTRILGQRPTVVGGVEIWDTRPLTSPLS
jgi:hypothetical protein